MCRRNATIVIVQHFGICDFLDLCLFGFDFCSIFFVTFTLFSFNSLSTILSFDCTYILCLFCPMLWAYCVRITTTIVLIDRKRCNSFLLLNFNCVHCDTLLTSEGLY